MAASFAEQEGSLFEAVLQGGLPHVDKTGFFPTLYESFSLNPIFLARPRGFGKSLLLAALDDFFTGRTGLFRGLQAEKFMSSDDFMARPVVHLDMGAAGASADGVGGLKRDLVKILDKSAGRHGVRLSRGDPESRFGQLLELAAAKSPDGRCVLLVDGHDGPVAGLIKKDRKLWDRRLIRDARDVMGTFYQTIKSSGACLRFALLTGVTRFPEPGVSAGFDNLTDISLSPEYAALCGFTQAELENSFAAVVGELAGRKKTGAAEIWGTLRAKYHGFSFDGSTRVYRPLSVRRFLTTGEAGDYWADAGSESFLRSFLSEKAAFLRDFSGLEVGESFAGRPGDIERAGPEGYLYQTGGLTLRRGESGRLSLDYPSGEVAKSMRSLVILAMMDDSVTETVQFYEDLSSSLGSGDPGLVFRHLWRVVSCFDARALSAAAGELRDHAGTGGGGPSSPEPGAGVYREFLRKYFAGMGVLAEEGGGTETGGAGLCARFLDKTYAVGLSLAEDGDAPAAAKKGLAQIRPKPRRRPDKNLVLLSLGLDIKLRRPAACAFALWNLEGMLAADGRGVVSSADEEGGRDPGSGGPAARSEKLGRTKKSGKV
ncbi:MAG: AAA family ATPase [Deltaproteobacteria bacterium]|jgi:hypothetical protein|nr:AAA family ATPase [Deltaproteobacteria bacterium]